MESMESHSAENSASFLKGVMLLFVLTMFRDQVREYGESVLGRANGVCKGMEACETWYTYRIESRVMWLERRMKVAEW